MTINTQPMTFVGTLPEVDEPTLLELYRFMLLARAMDERMWLLNRSGKAPFVISCQGHEAAQVGAAFALERGKDFTLPYYRGLATVRHGGSWGGYRAELLRFPEQHFSVVCLCNRGDSNPGKRAEQVADIYLASLLKSKEPKKEDDKKPKRKPAV